jgi:hypothetical protein
MRFCGISVYQTFNCTLQWVTSVDAPRDDIGRRCCQPLRVTRQLHPAILRGRNQQFYVSNSVLQREGVHAGDCNVSAQQAVLEASALTAKLGKNKCQVRESNSLFLDT